LISNLTVKVVVAVIADGKVNVALVMLPVDGTVVTSHVAIVVFEQLVDSEA
jgi:hypothetical protein